MGRSLERQSVLERDREKPVPTELALDDEPMEALLAHSMLAARVPKPRVNLTRFHGVFAPNSALTERR
jgi:hypothetical protein